MTEQENLLTVKQHLSAYEQGNIEKALKPFADEVDFRSPVSKSPPSDIKWSKPRTSKEEVKSFFEEIQGELTLEDFDAQEFTIKGDKVIVEGKSKGKVNSTDNNYEYEWVMIFALDNGLITRNYHYYDTSNLLQALKA